MVDIDIFGKYLSNFLIQIPKLRASQDASLDFKASLPKAFKDQAEQIGIEVSKHGYTPLILISQSKHGIVFSAKKDKLRYSIKACKNVVQVEDEYINIVEQHRRYPDGLKFYAHPNILALIESFESKDYHYTVTEECLVNLKTFMDEVVICKDTKSYTCTFFKYQRDLLKGLNRLTVGPYSESSTRFVSHIEPSDVLISYTTSIKLNPTFGQPPAKLGAIPFTDLAYSIKRQQLSCEMRFRKTYAHLLLFLLGMKEDDILFTEIEESVNGELYSYASLINEIIDSSESYARKLRGSCDLKQKQLLSDVFDNQSYQDFTYYEEFDQFFKIKLERQDGTSFKESNENDGLIAIGKREYISLKIYSQLYELSKKKLNEEEKDQFETTLETQLSKIEDQRKYMKLLRKVLIPKSVEIFPRQILRDVNRFFQDIYRNLNKWDEKLEKMQSMSQKVILKKKEARKEEILKKSMDV